MTKRLSSKHKIERRYGVLWEGIKSPAQTRAYPAGQHGPKGLGKSSGYGQQVTAKQRLKGHYGNITEKQFRNTYLEASRLKGDCGENFLALLERRLDAVVYRLKFAPTVFSARQFVNHGHVLVNGKRVNIPSYRLKVGDIVTLGEKMRQNALFATASGSSRQIPDYLSFDASACSGTLSYSPDPQRIPFPFDPHINFVVEYYSR
ncbi:MAG: 30S ribosomal protein S4 [Alphaproteobacteria bacterium 40-19]|nr:MAG: 30S ribosomal protein S4 [Alphaproteobacteria bacterium 40-19]